MNAASPSFAKLAVLCMLIFCAAVGYWLYEDVLPRFGLTGGGQPSAAAGAPDTRWYADTIAANPNATDFNISTAGELAGLAAIVNGTWGGSPTKDSFSGKSIYLSADIDLSGYRNWVPIGVAEMPNGDDCFSGMFNGNGHTISNLAINRPRKDLQGLFGLVFNGRVGGFKLENANVRGRDHVGGAAGQLNGNAHIIKTSFYGSVSGQKSVGALVGSAANRSSVVNSYSAGTVSGREDAGGISGTVWDRSSVGNCYTVAAVSAKVTVGGIAGTVRNQSRVSACAALNPEVKGRAWVAGRAVGEFIDGKLLNNAAYDGMKNAEGNSSWGNRGSESNDAEDYSAAAINASPTLNGRFRYSNGWTTEKGKLPGLHGKAAEMPPHLRTGAAAPVPATREIIRDSTVDPRNGQKYNTVKIGAKTWTAENMNFVTDSSWCYRGADSNCVKYGRLYTWKAAKKACPSGWRMPDNADWDELADSAGGSGISAGKLKSTSGWKGWEDEDGHYSLGNGSDEFGFSALPGGYRITGGRFTDIGSLSVWWSASDIAVHDAAWIRYLILGNEGMRAGFFSKSNGYAVRCVREE
ncbi:MAG: fibrobacter succinogenes major paralogous domain-containing protein [Chitinispirillia bacterium]|nr:fibrobacter succinogenes major paralogous domain-containing protein [Chitinispirillia bacterium]